jgi:uncharacterized protein YwgA
MKLLDAYDFVHLVLYAAGGRIEGRTKLQKLVYFAGVLTGMLDELGYRSHYYGPYSSKVTAAIDDLRSLGFLEQRTTSGGAIDPHGFEIARYDHALTKDGLAIAEEKARTHHKTWNLIQGAVKRLEQSDFGDYVQLSIAAKMNFLVSQAKEPVSRERLVEMGKRFGWNVSEAQVAEACKWLETLQLVGGQQA